MTSEIYLTTTGHAKDCDWHVDQYPWECTCGFIPRKKAMDDLIAQDADLIDIEPVAYRYGFDGYGWQYIDNGSGSDWTTRHPDAEPLYAHPPADRIEALEAADLIETQAREIERLRGALEPFAFREMEKDEGLADTQYVWETIHSDRVQDWFSYEEIEAARAALGDSHDQ